jgi:transposase-like protein
VSIRGSKEEFVFLPIHPFTHSPIHLFEGPCPMRNRIDNNQLLQLIRNGDTVSEAARKLGVNKATVSVRLKELNVAINRNVAIRAAHKIVDREINALDQLQKINRDANELLDLLMRWNRGEDASLQVLESQVRKIKVRGQEEEVAEYRFKDPRELALKAMQEIRGQLKLQLEIFQALFDMQAVKQFQTEVLEVIGSVSTEARDEIIRRLTERNALRSALDLNRAEVLPG